VEIVDLVNDKDALIADYAMDIDELRAKLDQLEPLLKTERLDNSAKIANMSASLEKGQEEIRQLKRIVRQYRKDSAVGEDNPPSPSVRDMAFQSDPDFEQLRIVHTSLGETCSKLEQKVVALESELAEAKAKPELGETVANLQRALLESKQHADALSAEIEEIRAKPDTEEALAVCRRQLQGSRLAMEDIQKQSFAKEDQLKANERELAELRNSKTVLEQTEKRLQSSQAYVRSLSLEIVKAKQALQDLQARSLKLSPQKGQKSPTTENKSRSSTTQESPIHGSSQDGVAEAADDDLVTTISELRRQLTEEKEKNKLLAHKVPVKKRAENTLSYEMECVRLRKELQEKVKEASKAEEVLEQVYQAAKEKIDEMEKILSQTKSDLDKEQETRKKLERELNAWRIPGGESPSGTVSTEKSYRLQKEVMRLREEKEALAWSVKTLEGKLMKSQRETRLLEERLA
jgi:hypothetical protein